MWIAACDKPYYPEVHFFETEEEANVCAKEMVEMYQDKDGHHICVSVIVAEVKYHTPIRTCY